VAIVVAALALPAIAFVVTRVHLGGSDGLPGRLRDDLAAEVQSILENSTTIAHVGMADHDHSQAGPVRVMCAVDPFGVDPATATDAGQVRRVYAQHLCAIGAPGTPWEWATKSAGPVVVSLGPPPTVAIPQPRQDYRTQVQQMIPAQYLTRAFGTFAHPDLVARLRQRFLARVSSASPSPPPATPSP
jgi:hypothetical protein